MRRASGLVPGSSCSPAWRAPPALRIVPQASWYEQWVYGSITHFTPLMAAAGEGNLDIVEALLRAGGDPNVQELYLDAVTGKTKPYGPVLEEDPAPPILAALIKCGADPNLADDTGETPLMAAASDGDYEGCYLLLEAGADKGRKVDSQNQRNDLPERQITSAYKRARPD